MSTGAVLFRHLSSIGRGVFGADRCVGWSAKYRVAFALVCVAVVASSCESSERQPCLSNVQLGDSFRIRIDRIDWGSTQECTYYGAGLSEGMTIVARATASSTRKASANDSDYCRSFVVNLTVDGYDLSPSAKFANSSSTDGVVSAVENVSYRDCSGELSFDLSPTDAGSRFALPVSGVDGVVRIYATSSKRVGSSCLPTYCFGIFSASLSLGGN